MDQTELKTKKSEAGELLIREGRYGTEMYILVKGKVEVSIEGISVAVIDQKGSFIGEISALMGTKRIATVKTLEPCTFFVVEDLSRHFTENPESGFLMAKTLAGRLIDMNRSFVELKKSLLELVKREIIQKAGEEDKKAIQTAIGDIEKNLVANFILNSGESEPK